MSLVIKLGASRAPRPALSDQKIPKLQSAESATSDFFSDSQFPWSHGKRKFNLKLRREKAMSRIATFVIAFFAIGVSALWADFSYTETTRITGGSLLNMTRFVPGAGSLKEPQMHTIAVKGGKMVTYDKDSAMIIDADAETMTQIDF